MIVEAYPAHPPEIHGDAAQFYASGGFARSGLLSNASSLALRRYLDAGPRRRSVFVLALASNGFGPSEAPAFAGR
eukprot:3349387-Alexandrium_andersonii.AAC.1